MKKLFQSPQYSFHLYGSYRTNSATLLGTIGCLLDVPNALERCKKALHKLLSGTYNHAFLLKLLYINLKLQQNINLLLYVALCHIMPQVDFNDEGLGAVYKDRIGAPDGSTAEKNWFPRTVG